MEGKNYWNSSPFDISSDTRYFHPSDDVNARQISKGLSHKICFEGKEVGEGKKKRESKEES